jgi:hypothetical protein
MAALPSRQRRRLAEALDHDRAEHAAAGECRHRAGVSGRERADALGRRRDHRIPGWFMRGAHFLRL